MGDAELFDTHCHLNLGEYFPQPSEDIFEARRFGVSRLNIVGIDLESSVRAVEIAESGAGLYATAGVHPNSAANFGPEAVDRLRLLCDNPKTVAIGEIGLDYHWDLTPRERQRKALEVQLELSEELQFPVVFHCREAHDDLLAILERRPRGKWLFHCWSGNASQSERAISLGGTFGVDGPLTYRKAEELREFVRRLPKDKLVIETDSPFLAPEPVRGRPNRPDNLRFVNAAVAACWGVPQEESARITTENARRFFGV